MSGHGSWSGQGKREQRGQQSGGASGVDGEEAVADVDVSAYSGGDLDSVYATYDGYADEYVYDAQAADELFASRNAGSRVISDGFSGDMHADIAKATESILTDFPMLKSLGGTIGLEDPPDSSYNRCAWSEVGDVLNGGKYDIGYSNVSYSNMPLEEFTNRFSNDYHYPNSTAGAVAAHELAHALDARLTYLQSGGGWDGHDSWNKGTVAKTILTRAAKRVGLTTERHPSVGTLTSLAKEHISGYGGTNIHEALSEGFGQFYAMGNMATPFARAIYDEARKYARDMS